MERSHLWALVYVFLNSSSLLQPCRTYKWTFWSLKVVNFLYACSQVLYDWCLLVFFYYFILEHFNIVNECELEAIKHGTCEAGLQAFSPMPVDVSSLFGGRVAVVV